MTWLDVRLAVRMLVKYPGLTVVGTAAMAFAIAVGLVVFQVVGLFVFPTLPLPGADRIVQITSWDVATSQGEQRLLHDFVGWRESLRTITDVGAWRDTTRNLDIGDGDRGPVYVAEMSASGFRVASGVALFGRVLVAGDEPVSAPLVAVLGHELWRTRFGGDPDVIGRLVRLGADEATVVGVMPEGFAFPVAHELWLPLRTGGDQPAPRSGPPISIFGVLAPGETVETARAEMTALGRRAAADLPASHQHLEPGVKPYAAMDTMQTPEDLWIMLSMYVFVVLLLVLICSNVGLLLFARAATREGDFIVRTALGASRGRLVSQVFAEALAIGGVAAVLGVAGAGVALRQWGVTFLESNLGRLPFWYDLDLAPSTVLAAAALALTGAAVAGVMPALKITRGLHDRLKQNTAGAGGLQFGGTWSAVIVAQVAVTVALPALVYWEQWQFRHVQQFDPGYAAEQFLTVKIDRDVPVDDGLTAVAAQRQQATAFTTTLEELRRRLAAAPGIAGVTFADGVPAAGHPRAFIEMSDDASNGVAGPGARRATGAPLRIATLASIDPSYFEVVGAPMLAGRAFTAADVAGRADVAIVDLGFVDQVLQGQNPIGRQVRFALKPGEAPTVANPWLEIVGVVPEVGVGAPTQKGRAAGLYRPVPPDAYDEVYMMVHARGGDPMALAPRVRDIAFATNPALRLVDFKRANEINDVLLWVMRLWMRATLVMSGVALVLALAGIYAILSFTVSRRTREIGVRVALGASRQGIVKDVFRRPAMQIGAGIVGGAMVIALFAALLPTTEFPGSETGLSAGALALLAAHAVVMLGICLLACIVPTRRALGVDPTTALRME